MTKLIVLNLSMLAFLFQSFAAIAQSQCAKLIPLHMFRVVEHELVGIEHLEPNSQLLIFYMNEINKINSINGLPEVSFNDITNIREINKGGVGSKKLYRATLNGITEVFIKVFNPEKRKESQLINEAKNSLILNKTSQKPEFYGLVQLPNNDLALVYNYIEGVSFPSNNRQIPDGFTIFDTHISQIRSFGLLLDRLGYTYTPDIQFVLTNDGQAHPIDMEFFFKKRPSPQPVNLPYNPIQNTEELAQELELAKTKQNQIKENTSSERGQIIIPGQATPRQNILEIIVPNKKD